jgi:hypothetical protein
MVATHATHTADPGAPAEPESNGQDARRAAAPDAPAADGTLRSNRDQTPGDQRRTLALRSARPRCHMPSTAGRARQPRRHTTALHRRPDPSLQRGEVARVEPVTIALRESDRPDLAAGRPRLAFEFAQIRAAAEPAPGDEEGKPSLTGERPALLLQRYSTVMAPRGGVSGRAGRSRTLRQEEQSDRRRNRLMRLVRRGSGCGRFLRFRSRAWMR